ncbi:MAG: response regulator [Desulfobulbaceae bacterium]|nr:response regulator [Desulfobulbaceae bacterium]
MPVLTHLSIKNRLLANSALLLTLFVLSLAVHQYALNQVESSFLQRQENRAHYDEKALAIQSDMLKAGQSASEFVLNKELFQADQVEQQLNDIERLAHNIRQYAEEKQSPEFVAHAENIASATSTYKRLFRQLTDAYSQRGLNPESGMIGNLRHLAHKLFDLETTEHAVGPVLTSLNKVQSMLMSDEGTDFYSQDQAEKKALTDLTKLFLSAIPNTEKNRTLYTLFDQYQLAIKNHLQTLTDPAMRQHSAATALLASKAAAALTNRVLKKYVPDVATLVLQIRRYEKDYLARENQFSIDMLYQAIDDLRMAFASSEIPEADIIATTSILDEYKNVFNAVLAVDRNLDDLNNRLLAESTHVENSVEILLADAIRNDTQFEAKTKHFARLASTTSFAICLLAMALGLWLSVSVNRSINRPLRRVLDALDRISQGDYTTRITQLSNDEVGKLSDMFNRMAESIAGSQWLAAGRTEIAEQLRENKEEERLARDIITFLAHYINAQAGAFHVAQADGMLRLTATFCHSPLAKLPTECKFGEGLVGEAALGQRLVLIDNLPADYLHLQSGLGDTSPISLLLLPVLWQNRVRGVIELASIAPFTEEQRTFLQEVAEGIAIALYSCRQRQETLALLSETQRQASILQAQQEELRAVNEELEEQTSTLRQNEEELKAQQEELQSANEELEEKSESLLRQRDDIAEKNRDLEEAWSDIDAQAKELAASNRYKSEFLANMSHELRTPLNSLLLLARNLSQNKSGNLLPPQVESAEIIYNSGHDLLRLINDILDLSKIEAGHMDIVNETISLRGLGDWLREDFSPLLEEKNLQITVTLDDELPASMISDRLRLEQILRNLVGNAIKFTEHGGVTVRFLQPENTPHSLPAGLAPQQSLAIEVEDTGIGVSPEQQKIIFDAFKQAEGGTSRRYGGTGLGLSISKKLAELLGGEITLRSQAGKGATFTLFLPLQRDIVDPAKQENTLPQPALIRASPTSTPIIDDDRETLVAGDKRLLIIEDDLTFAKVVVAQGRKKGFKCLAAATGIDGLHLAKTYIPSAIILDIRLPDIDGWQVLETIKNDPSLRHIPVHMMSGQEKTIEAFKKGAIGFLSKPVSEDEFLSTFARLEEAISKRVRDLLVVEDDTFICQGITELIGNGDVIVTSVASGEEAIAALQAKKYDCMILDIGLPDISGFELLDRLRQDETIIIPPVIIYTGRDLTREEGQTLAKYTDTVIIKGVKTEERLLDETALFLHRVVSKLPLEKRKMIASLYDQDTMFRDKRIMVVDDDMRNAFALSRILEERGMKIILANDGRHALELLDKDPAIDLILMDIMMPVLDGYQTTMEIRAQERFWDLPIIALTAKALPEDKEKCMASGASDYLAKPINEDRLLAMMRVWLYR